MNLQPDYYMKCYRMQVVQKGFSAVLLCDRAEMSDVWSMNPLPCQRLPSLQRV